MLLWSGADRQAGRRRLAAKQKAIVIPGHALAAGQSAHERSVSALHPPRAPGIHVGALQALHDDTTGAD